MTAVASPPSLQSLPRWGNGNGAQGGLNTMSADEVSRMFQPRKTAQRTNSSSSVASSTTSASSAPAAPQSNGDAPPTNGDPNGMGPRKKPARGLWPPSKSEPVAGITNGRSQPLPAASSQSATPNMSAVHQPSSILPSQGRSQIQSSQQNESRSQVGGQIEPQPILVLRPLTGTFERKHISVPYAPESMRIGRQTNVKTVPTPINGYFDSKVLSRQHAEVWATAEGNIMIRDVKSSNGTFINGNRLSAENRDSDPHPLREGDTLELGIDIVSEDQKSIVHHKVSAKVELAGVYGNGTNVLDLNFGDMDPSGNNVGSNNQQLRGRGGSQGSMGPNGRMAAPPSVAGSNANMIGPQRQMNMWLNPITIEQVVKKLTAELKQAKQQSQDLHRTGDFFSTLLALEPGQEIPKSAEQHRLMTDAHPNGNVTSASLESNNPFSQPPVPPPQQPLPEKPDMAAFVIQDSAFSQPQLHRSETQRPLSGSGSPSRDGPQSSQILSLVEALNSAKREIDSQGDRVKHLEVLLHQERKARESAEERARRFEGQFPAKANGHVVGDIDETAFQPPLEVRDDDANELTNGYDDNKDSRDAVSETSSIKSDSTTRLPEDLHTETLKVDASTSRLQERIDFMVREMDEMKVSMERYKRRAENAEAERDTLRDMVQKIRDSGALSNGKTTSKALTTPEDSSLNDETITDTEGQALISAEQGFSLSPQYPRLNGSASSSAAIVPDFKELERTVTTVLQQTQSRGQGPRGHGNLAVQGAPYASMVGVVLIGVGIMTWLNGWQRGER